MAERSRKITVNVPVRILRNATRLTGKGITQTIIELRRGLRSRAERARVLPLLDGCRLLEDPPRLWEEAGDLGYLLRRAGATVKTLDLLIAVCALSHGLPVLTAAADLAVMRRAGVGPACLAGRASLGYDHGRWPTRVA